MYIKERKITDIIITALFSCLSSQDAVLVDIRLLKEAILNLTFNYCQPAVILSAFI